MSKVFSNSLTASFIMFSGNVHVLKFFYLLLWAYRYSMYLIVKYDILFLLAYLHVYKISGFKTCMIIVLNVKCPMTFFGKLWRFGIPLPFCWQLMMLIFYVIFGPGMYVLMGKG